MVDLTVGELWRFPVKSMGGEPLTTATVDSLGIEGDRRFGMLDVETGGVLTARREPRLLFASAHWSGGQAIVTLPDGTETTDDGVLSDWLGHPVSLVAAGDEGGTYEVPLDFEHDQNWVSWQGPPDAWHDSGRSRLSLVSRSTVGDWDLRRFRTNVVLDGRGEDELVGSRARIGSEVTIDVTKQIDRCVMVTRPQPGLDRDLDVLRTINRDRASLLAVGALVVSGGRVSVGDRLELA